MTPERAITILFPVLVGLSGWIVQIVARYFPGHPNLDRDQLAAAFGLGATAGIAAGLKWLHERGKQNARKAVLASESIIVESDPAKHAPGKRLEL